MDPGENQAWVVGAIALYELVKGHARAQYLSESESAIIVAGLDVFLTTPSLRIAAQEGKYDDVITEIVSLKKAVAPPQPKEPAETPNTLKTRDVIRIQSAWTSKFDGPNLSNLKETIKRNEDNYKSGLALYARVLPLVNSSGVGKSRLIDEYGKMNLGIIFTFRRGHETGYPPGDPEIFQFLRRDRDIDSKDPFLEHARIISIFAASTSIVEKHFKRVNQHLKISFPADFHRYMAPRKIPLPDTFASTLPADKLSATRSDFRKTFCREVLELAKTYLKTFKDDVDWLPIFSNPKDIDTSSMKDHPLVQSLLLQPLKGFTDQLRNIGLGKGVPPLFFCFDEISNLQDPHTKESGYSDLNVPVALKRVISMMIDIPVWSFVLSTRKPLTVLAPPVTRDPSSRVRSALRIPVRPFFAFTTGVGQRIRMQTHRAQELSRPLSDFSLVQNVCQHGRPLWQSYGDTRESPMSSIEIRSMVLSKLLDRQGTPIPTPDLEARSDVLAILSARLTLDLVFNDDDSSVLEETLIHSKLRVITDIDPTTDYVKSAWVEEPIVSEACAGYFSGDRSTSLCREKWLDSLTLLYDQCLTVGLVDRGRTGELVGQMLLLMGRDNVFANDKDDRSARPDGNNLTWASPFKLSTFLELTFTKCDDILKTPARIYAMNPQSGKSEELPPDGSRTTATLLGQGWLNFTHFVDTDQSLKREELPEFLHGLLMHQAAAQLKPGQPDLDLLVPIYCGNPKLPFDRANLGALAIQIKNSKDRNVWNLDSEKLQKIMPYIFPDDMPVLAIMLELGVETTPRKSTIEATRSYRNNLFSFRIIDKAQATFKFMSNAKLVKLINKILKARDYEETDPQARVWTGNLPFRRHTFADRYPDEDEVDDGMDLDDDEDTNDDADLYT